MIIPTISLSCKTFQIQIGWKLIKNRWANYKVAMNYKYTEKNKRKLVGSATHIWFNQQL